MSKFSKEQREKLANLNARLHKLERQIIPRAKQINKLAKSTKDVWDHKNEAKLSFYSNGKLLMTYDQCLRDIDEYFYTKNQSEFQNLPSHEMYGEWHCWFYHCLYDHTRLSWDEILTIDEIEAVIKAHYDYNPKELHLAPIKHNGDESIFSLNKKQWSQVDKINKALAKFQNILARDAKKLENKLNKRIKSGKIKDFLMSFTLTFYLRKDDPAYDENSDNIVANIYEPIIPGEFSKAKSRWSKNCNEYFGRLGRNVNDKAYFCYLFYAFCNNTHITYLRDILRIGTIDLIIQWEEQYE